MESIFNQRQIVNRKNITKTKKKCLIKNRKKKYSIIFTYYKFKINIYIFYNEYIKL